MPRNSSRGEVLAIEEGGVHQGPVLYAFDRSTWTPAEETYFEIVDEALEARENLAISNGKPQHAVYLLRTFLANAEQSLRIYSGRLARFIDGGEVAAFADRNVLEGARVLLARPAASIQALVENPLDCESGDHPLVELAEKMKTDGNLQGRLEIRQADETALGALDESGFGYHWMVMDGKAFRLETDPDQARATVNFGDVRGATTLDTVFSALWPHSTEVATVCP